jgi:hypothetical protein
VSIDPNTLTQAELLERHGMTDEQLEQRFKKATGEEARIDRAQPDAPWVVAQRRSMFGTVLAREANSGAKSTVSAAGISSFAVDDPKTHDKFRNR